MIVVDTNVIAYLLLWGDFTEQAEIVYQFDSDWVAPYLWRSEFRNILALYLRKKYLSLENAREIMTQAEHLMSGKEFELGSQAILSLISTSSLSAYDCEYVVLAQRLGVNLVTNDKKILTLFPNLAVALKAYN